MRALEGVAKQFVTKINQWRISTMLGEVTKTLVIVPADLNKDITISQLDH